MKELIKKTLDRCGYGNNEPTEENLLECFLDYVDGGVFGNLTYEEAKEDYENGDITLKQICLSLITIH